MANLFEKPVAANPISEFVGLPLEFINNSMQQRQQKYDQAKADMDVLEDELLKTNALAGDRTRQQAILKGFDDEITSIAETGDLSMVQGKLDNLKRKMSREMAYGELGSINKNFGLAGAYQTNMKKLYQQNKISNAGQVLGGKSISDFRTTPNADGSWGTFSGYSPSNLTNPTEALRKSIKGIHAKYDELGQENITSADVVNNLTTELANNPEILRSMQEQFMSGYKGENASEDFAKYYKDTVEGLVKDATYQKKLKNIEKAGKGKGNEPIRGRQWGRVMAPSSASGELDAQGMNVASGREFFKNILRRDSTAEFDKYTSSAKGKEEIKFMEWKSGSKFPDSYGAQVEWIEQNAMEPISSELITETVPTYMTDKIISDKGDRLTNGAVRDMNGKVLSKPEQQRIFGSDDAGHKAVVGGLVGEYSDLPYGSIVIIGKDGETYIQENLDTEILGSLKFAKNRLNTTQKTNTGHNTLTFTRPVNANGITLSPGTYEARFNPEDGVTTLTQNGVKRYMYGKNEDGVNTIVKVPEN